MTDNEFLLTLVGTLDKAKSKKQTDSDIKELEKVVRNLRLTATLLKGKSKQEINQAIKQFEGQLNHIKLQAKIDTKNIKYDVDKALQNISFKDLKDIDINVDSSKTKLKVQKAIADAKKVAQNNPITVNVDLKKEKLNNQLTTYLSKNSKIRESEPLLKEADKLREKIAGINDKDSLRDVTDSFQLFKSECAATGYQAKSTTEKIKGLIGNATKIGSAFGLASLAVSNFQKSLKTIRESDSIITEISKTSNMTKAQLTELGNQSFDVASKYGRLSQDFLLGVQEMARSGYETASKGMAELSLMAQAAGDMSADLANNYIIATDNAYKLNGEVSKLNAILDGQNAISNSNSVALVDMAEGMSKAGTVASSYRVSIEDLSAMIGTMEAVTKSGGSEVGNAIKAILINLQNVTSNKMIDTLNAANASMTEFVDGTEKLRNPIDILRDLAKTFNQLDEDDPLRAEILTNVGQKYHAAKLGALLQNMDMFDKMLVDYSNGAGSALREADLSANDLTGTLNKLSNSWDALVNSITSKSTIKGGVGFFDTLLQSATKLIDTVDVLPVALASFTAFTTAKNKDVGISQIFNEDGKFDVQGNFMGIDISSIKHYREASAAIEKWNSYLKAGKTDINDFGEAVVKNNSQLREYLKTCSVDAPASLKGYKAHLQAAGEATNGLRLSTILLNTAFSFGLGLAVQGVITGISKLGNHINDTRQKAQSLSDSMKNSLNSLASNSKLIKELAVRYNELSKGVDIAGNNVSLTASQYEEYKSIVSQLSELMPDLTTMFNAQGEKIGFVGGKLKDANKQWKEYIKNSASKFLTDGNGEGQTADDMIDDWNNTNTKLPFNYMDELKAVFGGYSKSNIEEMYSASELLEEYQKLYGMSQEELYDYFDKADRKGIGIGYSLKRFLKIDLDELKENEQYINTLRSDLNSYITEYRTAVESSSKQIQEIAQYMFLNDDDLYNGKLSEDASSYISNIISGLSNEFIKANFVDEDGKLVKAKIQSFVDSLVDSFTGENGVAITELFSKLFTLDTSKLSFDEIKNKVNGYISQLYALMQQKGESLEGFKLRIGISEETYISQDTETLINNVKGKLQDEFDGKVGELTLDELQIAAEKIEVPDGVLLSWDELLAKIKEVNESSSVDKTAQQLEELKETYRSASKDVTALTTALSESVSGTGLSSDSVDAVTSMFSDLKGYDEDKLLDKTANGLRLNTRELEKLKKEYDDNTAKEFYQNVEDAYNSWQDALRNGEEQAVTDELYDQYQQAAQLADQYVGLTSAYNKWQDALSTANEGEMYDTMQGKIKAMEKLWAEGRTNVDEFRAFADLISYKDLSGASQAEVEKAYSNSIGKIKRYFMEGEQGLENFLQDVHKANSEWAHMNKDGTWEFDFGVGGDKKVAKALEIDVEALQIILRKMSEYSDKVNIDFDFDSVAMMGKEADKAYDKLKKLGKIGKNMKFKFDTGDISEVNKQIEDAENVLNEFRDKDGNVDVNIEGAAEAQTILAKLLTEKQEIEKPPILKIDTSQLSGKAVGVITMLQKIQQEINTYDVQVKVGADTTETEKKIKEDIRAIKSSYGEELSDININLNNIDSARKELKGLGEDDIEMVVNAIVNHKKVDDYKKEKEKKTIEVETELNDTAVNEFLKKPLEKTIKAKIEVDSSELDKADTKKPQNTDKDKKATKSNNKNAHADGTFNILKDTLASRGFANASGNISIPKDQTALVNELGEELIVRDGRWFTVKGGAQFTELKKGDIVFNHLQTRQLLKNGKITSSDNRGKFAHSKGTFGNAFSDGTINFTKYKDGTPKTDSKKSSKSKKSKKKDSDKKKDSKQLIDWIERKLDVLQDKIDLTKAKFDNLFSVKRQKNNLNNQIKQTTKLLNAQGKAVTKYQKKADSIKLSEPLKKKVRNGDIKGSLSELIREYGEKTAKQINKYQDYIDKVKDAKKAVAELKAEIKDLSKQKLDLKLEDNERKRTYQEARYANATTADEKRKILNKEINTYKSDNKEYAEYYKESKKQRKKDGNTAKKAVNKTKGLGKSAKQKIKKLIKQGKEIPSALMKKVKKHSTATYQKLLDYNNSVDFAADVLRDKKLANEQNETNMREKRIERAQNYADEAEAKYSLNQQYEANAVSAKDKNKYEAESLKYLNKQYDKLIKIAELEGDVTEQKRLQAEKQEKNKESYQTMYDNIKAEYDNKTGLNDARISTIQSEIATLEAAGQSVSKSLYDEMMKINEGTKEKLLKERAELEEAGKKFKYGSEEWYAWQNDMEAIDQSLYSCTQQTIEFQKAINELDFKKFSLMASQLDATKSHLDFLVDMLSHEDLTSKESGGLTDAGFATISLRFANMDNHKNIIENAQKELDKLYEKHADGTDGYNEEEFMAKREEQLDIIRSSTEAIADEKDAILDLVENAMQVQIDAIDELIEKKKKALATEKDYYEYQKRVAKQTKNIALIEKQIAALSGDHSEEARAKLQKLQLNLEEAQEELRDTEYDKWYDDQTDMLDNLADEVEDFWERIMNDLRKDINGSMDSLLQMVTDNPEAVARALDELGLGDALSIITTYNPDGTHTNSSIDYGGNSYESTYDETGTNVNNKFDTSIDNLDSASDDLKDTAEDLAKQTEEETEAKRKAFEKEQVERQKQIEKQAAYDRADSIMAQSADGKNKVIADMEVPMSGVQAAVEEFLSSSALHKPTTDAGKKRMKTDPLLKYIAENYNGKTLSNVNEARLGAFFGIPVKNKNKVTEEEAKKILKAFKNAGFADGGIADTLNKAAKDNGDDGIITIQKGEAVLTKEETKAVKKIAGRYIPVGPKITPEQERILMAHLGMPFEYSDMMPKYESAPVNNTNNTSVTVGDINVHLDGSGIKDEKSFCDMITHSTMVQSAIDQSVSKGITKSYANTFGRF